MKSALKITEASSLAIHACVLIARENGRKVSTKEIAERLDASWNHLSKVLQRLVRANIVSSQRGPDGGFTLIEKPAKVTLLTIYEAIEGPFDFKNCLFGRNMCMQDKCVLGDLLVKVNREVLDYFSNTKLSDLV